MTKRDSINYLKKLYVLLDNLMGESLFGIKYVRSIRKGIKSLERKNLSVDNGMFKVKVNDTKGVINSVSNIKVSTDITNKDLIVTMTGPST